MARKWVQKVARVVKPSEFIARAKRSRASESNNQIKPSFIDSAKRSPNPTTRKRAVLAATFRKAKK